MSACSSCGAPIVWAKTAAGKAIPLDAEPVPKTRGLFTLTPNRGGPLALAVADEPRYVSHWATCPSASSHRQRA